MRAFLTRDGRGIRGGVWKGNVLQKDRGGTAIQKIIPETEVLP